MAEFKIAHKITAGFEGGYTDHPDDNGNWTGGIKGFGFLIGTNLGISAPLLKSYLGKMPSIDDMKNLSQETAQEIYKSIFWDQIKGDQIIDQEAANSIYDSCVNMGCKQAIKLCQRALQVPETGIMDETTLNALNNQK